MNLMEMVEVLVAQISTCVVKGKETVTVILNALGILSVGKTIVTLPLAFLLTVIAVMTLMNVRKIINFTAGFNTVAIRFHFKSCEHI